MKPEIPDTNAARVQRTAVVVLGMHRSGTSAMSRVLSLAGAQLPRALMAPGDGNPMGHWEPLHVADLNERILQDLDSSWYDVFGPRRFRQKKIPLDKYLPEARFVIKENYKERNFVVLKEPRVSIFLDLWIEALRQEGFDIYFVVMIRSPAEIAESLRIRDGFVSNRSNILWATYMLACVSGTNDKKRIFVKFDDLLDDPEAVLDRLENELGLLFPRRTWESALEIQDFLKQEHRHHRIVHGLEKKSQYKEIDRFYSYLDAASRGEPWNVDVTREVSDWLNGLENAVGPLLKQLERQARNARIAEEAERESASASRQEFESTLASVESQRVARETELNDQLAQIAAEAQRAQEANVELEAALAAARTPASEQEAALKGELAAARDHFAAREAELNTRLARAVAEAREAGLNGANLENLLSTLRRKLTAREAEFDETLTEVVSRARAAEQRAEELENSMVALQTRHALQETDVRDQLLRAQTDAQAALQRARDLENTLDDELRLQRAQAATETNAAQQQSAELARALSDAISNSVRLDRLSLFDLQREAVKRLLPKSWFR